MRLPIRVLAIVGPTASGKSALAVELAKEFNGVVISADSRQIYRGLDIGTTKISKSEMSGMPHYMLGIVDPDQSFGVADYQRMVYSLLRQISAKNRKSQKPVLPILVGGTGLYVQAVTDGWVFPNVPPNPSLRRTLAQLSTEELARRLLALDPDTRVDLHNPRRLIRALEIKLSGGEYYPPAGPPFEVLKIGLDPGRAAMQTKITKRVHQLDLSGLVAETKRLIRKKYSFDLPALTALGYRDVADWIGGRITKVELLNRLVKLHFAYAKRQMTWFRRDKDIIWLSSPRQATPLVRRWLADDGKDPAA